jgi:hypothetical protein
MKDHGWWEQSSHIFDWTKIIPRAFFTHFKARSFITEEANLLDVVASFARVFRQIYQMPFIAQC